MILEIWLLIVQMFIMFPIFTSSKSSRTLVVVFPTSMVFDFDMTSVLGPNPTRPSGTIFIIIKKQYRALLRTLLENFQNALQIFQIENKFKNSFNILPMNNDKTQSLHELECTRILC